MTSYQQMGHDSANLLQDPYLEAFTGAILSPINYDQDQTMTLLGRLPKGYETILDPQLYVPRTERGKLRDWSYFPSDVDTANMASDAWWERVIAQLSWTCLDLGIHSLCSPAVIPRAYHNDYYAQMVRVGNQMASSLAGAPVQTLQTALINFTDIAIPDRPLEISSILSRSRADTIYLVLVSQTPPRRELSDPDSLAGAMRLISELKYAGLRVLVAYASSDMVLWKAAGADSCATGKFFNLRRFTEARFGEPLQGGQQIPYWFEESLLAFVRESDLIRLRRAGKLSPPSLTNPFGTQILEERDTEPTKAWLGLAWRQYLYAFADLEKRVSSSHTDVSTLLLSADQAWGDLDRLSPPVFMEERENDGTWVRQWRRALAEYGSI